MPYKSVWHAIQLAHLSASKREFMQGLDKGALSPRSYMVTLHHSVKLATLQGRLISYASKLAAEIRHEISQKPARCYKFCGDGLSK